MKTDVPGMTTHEARMRLALRQAKLAAEAGEVPVGAVIYNGGELAGQAWNQTRTLKDPTAHAEIIAITQAAAAAGDWRLTDSILYVTKEPCPMCAGAIVLARIPLVVWGMTDPLRGGAVSRFQILQSAELNHRSAVLTGVLEDECAALIKDFFKKRRQENKNGEFAE
jgi:tRNA(adenine34) deaminase